jgi:hypothetical protein
MAKQLFTSVQQEAYERGTADFFSKTINQPYFAGSELATEWKSGYDSAERSNARACAELN